MIQAKIGKDDGTTCRSNAVLSYSFASAKLSRPKHTLTKRFVAKNPVSFIPSSRKALAVNRAPGFGLSNFLYAGNTETGIAPRDEGAGGVWGGCVVAGGGCVGLKTECNNRPKA